MAKHSNKDEMGRAQLGAWGELLVQQELLTFNIDSARMTTDYGIDLVAYDPASKQSFSIQVKTRSPRLRDTRYSWGVLPGKCNDADLLAFAIKDRPEDHWYLTPQQFKKLAIRRKGLLVLRFATQGSSKRVKSISELNQFKGRMPGLANFLAHFRQSGAIAASA